MIPLEQEIILTKESIKDECNKDFYCSCALCEYIRKRQEAIHSASVAQMGFTL